jgi:hypothetical protein
VAKQRNIVIASSAGTGDERETRAAQ